MKVVIIEDEIRTADDLRSTLQNLDRRINFCATLDSIEAAVDYFSSHEMPELIFMDIQLADGLSFEIFKSVTITCPVIFCTAFDEYAMEAFKVNGIDYILKPFDDKSLAASLSKIKQLENHFSSGSALLKNLTELLAKPKSYKSGFLVSYKDKMIPVSAEDIACFYYHNDLTFLVTLANQKYLLDLTMDEIEEKVDPSIFYRANRQFIVSYKSIKEVEHYFARKLVVKVEVGIPEPIIVSKAKANSFLRWMENR